MFQPYTGSEIGRHFHVMATFSNVESGHLEPMPTSDIDEQRSLSEITSPGPSLFCELDSVRNHIPIQRIGSSDQQDSMNSVILLDEKFNI